jgi:membrane-associated protease RseP (regulator of RpoE activity)
MEIKTLQNFSQALSDKKPGDSITLVTDKRSYTLELGVNPDDVTKGYVGVQISQSQKIKDNIGLWILPNVVMWFIGLLYWLYVLNLGIGLFNLVPLGPIDGGRMLNTVLMKYFPVDKANRIFSSVSFFFLFLILINIGFAFLG